MWSMDFESRPALITSFLSSSTCGSLSWFFSACCFSWARDGGLWRGGERRTRMGERKEERRMRERDELQKEEQERKAPPTHTSQSCLFLTASPNYQFARVTSVLMLKRSVHSLCHLRPLTKKMMFYSATDVFSWSTFQIPNQFDQFQQLDERSCHHHSLTPLPQYG